MSFCKSDANHFYPSDFLERPVDKTTKYKNKNDKLHNYNQLKYHLIDSTYYYIVMEQSLCKHLNKLRLLGTATLHVT